MDFDEVDSKNICFRGAEEVGGRYKDHRLAEKYIADVHVADIAVPPTLLDEAERNVECREAIKAWNAATDADRHSREFNQQRLRYQKKMQAVEGQNKTAAQRIEKKKAEVKARQADLKAAMRKESRLKNELDEAIASGKLTEEEQNILSEKYPQATEALKKLAGELAEARAQRDGKIRDLKKSEQELNASREDAKANIEKAVKAYERKENRRWTGISALAGALGGIILAGLGFFAYSKLSPSSSGDDGDGDDYDVEYKSERDLEAGTDVDTEAEDEDDVEEDEDEDDINSRLNDSRMRSDASGGAAADDADKAHERTKLIDLGSRSDSDDDEA